MAAQNQSDLEPQGTGPANATARAPRSRRALLAGGAAAAGALVVSWQVTGIRQDAFANANRIVVEEQKPADERGTYLHPTLHGKPQSLAFDHARAGAVAGPALRTADPRP